MEPSFSAIIFDFNGVLIWDTPMQETGWNAMAEKLRGRPMTHEEVENHVLGVTNEEIISYLLGRPATPEEVARYTEEKESGYRTESRGWDGFHLSPGAEECLNTLRDRNIPRTIATSSEIGNVQFFFSELRLDRWFSFEKTMYDDGTFGSKPAPDIYLRAAEKLGVAPAACVVVEDSRSGLESAAAAGIGRVIALGPGQDHAALLAIPGVHAAIPSLAELPIGQLFPV